jgi:hypothetical protein
VVIATPVQNFLEGLAPILEFLQAHPFESKRTFQSEAIKPLQKYYVRGSPRLKALMGAVIFRRTRHTVLDLNWQSLEEVIKSLEFSAAERWAHNLALLEERNRIDASLPDHKGYSFLEI